MRVLALTGYGHMGASTRMRTLEFLPLLQEVGIEITVSPLLDDGFIDPLRAEQRSIRLVLTGYMKRLRMGVVGRQRVGERYSLQAQAARLVTLLRSVFATTA